MNYYSLPLTPWPELETKTKCNKYIYLYVAGSPEYLHHHDYTTVHPFCHILLAQGKVYEHQLSTDLKEKSYLQAVCYFQDHFHNIILFWVII